MLFKVLGLPLLPAYTDASFKLKTRFDTRNELTLLGLGGIDRELVLSRFDLRALGCYASFYNFGLYSE